MLSTIDAFVGHVAPWLRASPTRSGRDAGQWRASCARLVGQIAELPFVERSLHTATVDVGKLSDRQQQLFIIVSERR